MSFDDEGPREDQRDEGRFDGDEPAALSRVRGAIAQSNEALRALQDRIARLRAEIAEHTGAFADVRAEDPS